MLRALAGFFLLAMKVGKVRFDADLRTLALLCGMTLSAFHRAVKDLIGAGWVRRLRNGGRRGDRTVWQLLLPGEGAQERTQAGGSYDGRSRLVPICAHDARLVRTPLAAPRPGDVTDPSHGTWTRRHGAWRTYMTLLGSGEAMSTKALAEATGYNPGSIRRHLVYLRELALVVTAEGSHEAIRPEVERSEQLDDEAGGPGIRERRALRIAQQRIAHRAWLEGKGWLPRFLALAGQYRSDEPEQAAA